MNSLPKTVIRQRRGYDLNPGPSALESSTLTTWLPNHPRVVCSIPTPALAANVTTTTTTTERATLRFRADVVISVLVAARVLGIAVPEHLVRDEVDRYLPQRQRQVDDRRPGSTLTAASHCSLGRLDANHDQQERHADQEHC